MLLKGNEKKKVTQAKDVAEILRAILQAEDEIDQDKEHFWSIGLNSNNKIIYIELVTLGILTQAVVAPREIFRMAISKGVKSIITAHNHPSGDVTPSPEDKKIIRKIIASGEILDIQALDHIIITNETHWSASEEGIN